MPTTDACHRRRCQLSADQLAVHLQTTRLHPNHPASQADHPGLFADMDIQRVKWKLLSHRRREMRHRAMAPQGIAPPTKWSGRWVAAGRVAGVCIACRACWPHCGLKPSSCGLELMQLLEEAYEVAVRAVLYCHKLSRKRLTCDAYFTCLPPTQAGGGVRGGGGAAGRHPQRAAQAAAGAAAAGVPRPHAGGGLL